MKKRSGSLSQSLLDLNALVASLKLVVIVGVNVLLIFGKENQTGDSRYFYFAYVCWNFGARACRRRAGRDAIKLLSESFAGRDFLQVTVTHV